MSWGKRKKPIIAIDGPAGVGKSTVGVWVAKRLGFLFINTGEMYRALAWKALQEGVSPQDHQALAQLSERLRWDFVPREGVLKTALDGQVLDQVLASEEVSLASSLVAAAPGVRRHMRKLQRAIGESGGMVMEGRDIATNVFPDADFKFYLDASLDTRALRRHLQLHQRGIEMDLDQVRGSILLRDRQDSERQINPLRRSPQAIVVDSTRRTLPEVVDEVLRHVQRRAGLGFAAYGFLLFLVRFLARLIYRLEVTGLENLPRSGGVLIACNHVSLLDPPVVAAAIASIRRPHFLAKREIFSWPLLGRLWRHFGAIPLNRTAADLRAVREALQLLKGGGCLVIFPEGTRGRGSRRKHPRGGVGFLAGKSGACVVPTRVINTDRCFRFRRLEVRLGRPTYFEGRDYHGFAARIMGEVEALA
ncbi:MAG: (d)CMP kinase [Elusimicrobia bacterium]|nr:(d)CMP kinase [Elusimicrobiota bacterium]